MYYERYGEVLEYKNVFFFKALIEEVKNNKTYDRIVIDEDLEEYRSNDMQQLDRVLFSNIDKITDEISDADIILVCTDRREKGDSVINQLFSMGIYNLLLGNDRNINPLCDIIRKPRTKKEAKEYLRIDTSLMTGNSMTRDEEVDEAQMINIIKYYDGIKNQPDKYVETFDKIAKQYSRIQLKIIVSYLPKEVRDVILQVDRYKYLNAADGVANTEVHVNPQTIQNTNSSSNNAPRKDNGSFWPFGKKKSKEENDKTSKNAKLPSVMETRTSVDLSSTAEEQKKAEVLAKAQAEIDATNRAAKVHAENQAELARRAKAEAERKEQAELAAKAKAEADRREQEQLAAKAKAEVAARQQAELEAKAKAEAAQREQAELAAKARADAERKEQAALEARAKAEAAARQQTNQQQGAQQQTVQQPVSQVVKPKNDIIVEIKPNPNAPEKVQNIAQAAQSLNNTVGISQGKSGQAAVNVQPAQQTQPVRPVQSTQQAQPVRPAQSVPSGEALEQNNKMKEEQEKLALEQKKIREAQEKLEEERRKLREEQERLANEQNKLRDSVSEYNAVPQYANNVQNMSPVSGNVNKMVVFVGANKSGTTFVTNAIAHSLAASKIRTSILDMTRDKSMFYLYNQNDKSMRKRAAECMQRVSDGEDIYLETNNSYLKVYTTVPGSVSDVRRGFKHKTIIETVKANCNVTVVDADFTTPIDYFDQADAIFIVQDLDLLKMPDTTLFLRELKNRGMNMKKIKIIINKYVKTSLTPKNIMQALSYYSDPAMSFVDELLPSRVDYSIIPYNLNNYAKYIDCVCHGVINYKGYSADFMQAVGEIAAIIYTKDSSKKSSKKLFG